MERRRLQDDDLSAERPHGIAHGIPCRGTQSALVAFTVADPLGRVTVVTFGGGSRQAETIFTTFGKKTTTLECFGTEISDCP